MFKIKKITNIREQNVYVIKIFLCHRTIQSTLSVYTRMLRFYVPTEGQINYFNVKRM